MELAKTSGEPKGGSVRHNGEDAIRALIVDDDEQQRTVLARVLRSRGIVAETAANGFLALDILERAPFDVVLVDVRMPGMMGPQFLQRVKAAGYPVEILMMTAFADIATTVSAVKAGAHGFLTKPFVSNESVVMEVLNAAEFRRLREKTKRLEHELATRPSAGELVGRSAPMRDVYRLIQGVATTSSTILVLGESGTGKELVARAIHDQSRRAGKPMVTVNCAAIPKELVESELFGHVRGAFTTAVGARGGLIEAAHEGTLFLDEIGDLPMSAQVKLLRTLQSGEVRPVGSDVVKTVDVRVVAATNVDLKAAIAAGTFRQDLFFRLNVIAVRLPPLRERGDDTLMLAHHFVQKHTRLAGRSAMSLSDDAALVLQRYDWPGNVRELEHAIEHAVVLSKDDVIHPRALPAEVQRLETTNLSALPFVVAPSSERPSASTMPIATPRGEPDDAPPREPRAMDALIEALGLTAMCYADAKKLVQAEFNAAYVEALLTSTSGSVSEAAARAGLDRSNFRRLVRTTSVDVSTAGPPSSPDRDAGAPARRRALGKSRR